MRLILFLGFFLIFLLEICESLDCSGEVALNVEHRLKNKLFCNYDKAQLPVKHHKGNITIQMKFIVKSFDYDDSEGSMTVNAWMSMSWKDEGINWDPSEYEGIKTIRHSSDEIWTPDINLYNSVISSGIGFCETADCMMNSSGNVACILPCTHTAYCSGDFTRWPFDQQNCSFSFGSWMKTGEELNYIAAKSTVKSKEAAQHSQWKIIATFFRKNEGKYASSPNMTYPSMIYTFLIERHSAFHIATTFVPALVIIVCNLISFWMNPDFYERFALLTINLFCHYIYFEQMFYYMPSNGDIVPNTLLFFRNSSIITAFLLCFTVILKLINKYNEKPAQWIESFTTIFTGKMAYGNIIFGARRASEDSSLLGENLKSLTKDSQIWRTFSNIIDKLMFTIVLITYFCMVIMLLPKGYDKSVWDGIAVEN